MPFLDEVLQEVSANHDDIHVDNFHIDALSVYFITKPETLDVVVASKFGDILSEQQSWGILGSPHPETLT